jgi:hypothetical protein
MRHNERLINAATQRSRTPKVHLLPRRLQPDLLCQPLYPDPKISTCRMLPAVAMVSRREIRQQRLERPPPLEVCLAAEGLQGGMLSSESNGPQPTHCFPLLGQRSRNSETNGRTLLYRYVSLQFAAMLSHLLIARPSTFAAVENQFIYSRTLAYVQD